MLAVIPLNLDGYLLSGEVDERQGYARCFRGWRRTLRGGSRMRRWRR